MRQESIRAVVVFPAPLGPSRATISPARTSKERFFCGYHLSESSCKPFGSDHLRADFTTTVGKGSGPKWRYLNIAKSLSKDRVLITSLASAHPRRAVRIPYRMNRKWSG